MYYTITVSKEKPSDAQNVSLADTWPSGFARGTVTPSQGTCTGSSSFTCSLGTIAAGSNATVTVNYNVPSCIPARCVTAVQTCALPIYPNATNNSASDTDAVTTSADLSITKS